MDRLYVLRVGKHLLCFEPVLLSVSLSSNYGLLMARVQVCRCFWRLLASNLFKCSRCR